MTRATKLPLLILIACAPALVGCKNPRQKGPDFSELYSHAAQQIGDERNPVIVIPGILGSKLVDADIGQTVWGAFVYGASDPDTPEGARQIALPMQPDTPLADLRDSVYPTAALDTFAVDVGLIRGLEISAYVEILEILGVSGYADRTLGEGGVDYGGAHYTCDQFAYDWRRDIAEQAVGLHALIQSLRSLAQEDRDAAEPPRVDVIAHSMGGLVLRYYLRYGPTPLPEDGSLPPLTWEGAEHVEHAILIGTPNAGSVLALRQLVHGVQFASLITPTYRPAVLGTMPAIYQLLPRARHRRVIEATTAESVDPLDPAAWERYGWGLADPDQDRVLETLLPEVESAAARRAIALDHLDKCLRRAEQLFRALDKPARPPDGTRYFLILGDAIDTPDTLEVDPETGDLRLAAATPGDDTVTRTSALMDERMATGYVPRLQSPIHWDTVLFLSSNHIGLTRDPAFTNFTLYTLLEKPRE